MGGKLLSRWEREKNQDERKNQEPIKEKIMKKNKVKYGSFVVSAFIVLMLGIMTEAKGYEQDPRVPAGSHELFP